MNSFRGILEQLFKPFQTIVNLSLMKIAVRPQHHPSAVQPNLNLNVAALVDLWFCSMLFAIAMVL